MRNLFLALFFLPSLLSAQVELNAKLRFGHTVLQEYFAANQAIALRQAEIPASLVQRYGFMEDFRQARALQPAGNNQVSDPDLERVFTLRFEGRNAQGEVNRLLATGAFEWVEENRSRQLHQATATLPNDDSLSAQWHHSYIHTFDGWDFSRGRRDIRIGVIDTGLDLGHPEFEGQVAVNSLEDKNGNGKLEAWPVTETRNGLTGDFDGIDDDGNGYIDDVVGFDFTDQPRSPYGGDFLGEDPDPADDNGHGTIVSGIIHAKADNFEGGAGIAPDCRLVVLRAFAASGQGEDDDIARAIIYAADNGIQLLNFSFGDIYPSLMMHEAIQYAYSRGVVMVGSSGNGTGDELHYPSGYNEVISVSASTYDASDGREYLWPLSSYGVTVDLCAPGSSIFTTALRDTAPNGTVTAYGRYSGTSNSAPMVTAAAALLFSHRGALSPQQTRGILTSSADDISEAGWDHFTGAGRLNLFRALQTVGAPNVQISSPINDRGTWRDSIYIIGTVLDPEFVRYHLEYQEGIEDLNEWMPIVSDQTYQTKEDTLALWDLRNVPEGEYTLRLRVDRSNGFTLEDRIRFVRDVTAPKVTVKLAVPIWDNEVRKVLVIFRDDDQAVHTLNYRRSGSSGPYQQVNYDRTTRNGEFLLEAGNLSSGTYDFFIEATNLAGLTAQSDPGSFDYQPTFINQSGYNPLSYTLPMGRFLEETYDFNGNGFPEVVMNEYNERLSFGKLKFYEFNGGFFMARDSLSFRSVLIPKDVADTDGNGLLELLASVNDSTYLLEQESAGAFPKKIIYTDHNNDHFPAGFADTDDDQQLELISKDFKDYLIFEGKGSQWSENAKMEDLSPDYLGSVAPRVVVADFDLDGNTETAFGDFDGDLILYEHRNGSYELSFLDTSSLTKSGSYITKGDFDGDGQMELFVAVHSSLLRNDDFEYNPLYWWLRIFKSPANDQYEVVWEDYLYDIDTENYNAATAGNLDQDPADELVFSTYPRTYVVDYRPGSGYEMQWFLYGSLCTHHIIADFNQNGVKELGLGRGDSTFFWEKNFTYMGPAEVTSLQGIVLGPEEVKLTWPASPGAVSYQLVQFPLDDSLGIGYSVTGTEFVANVDLESGKQYLYTMRSEGSNDSSGFGNFIIRRPHPNNEVDSIAVINGRQIEVFFSWPVLDRPSDKPYFVLNGKYTPSAIIQTGLAGKRLILAFDKGLEEGMNSLQIDSAFLDVDFGIFKPSHAPIRFNYSPIEEDFLHLTQWKAISEKEAVLTFNYPLSASALDSTAYSLAPVGNIKSVAFFGEHEDAVKVTIETARFGALGYPLSITVAPEVCAINGVCIQENEGNTATFSSFKQDLSEVFAFPNPYRPHVHFEGVRIANLTQIAHIRILTVSGRFVNELDEQDGDGGVTWDLRDRVATASNPAFISTTSRPME